MKFGYKASIELEGCKDVADLQDRIYTKFGIDASSSLQSSQLVLKWKGQELKSGTKISSLDLSEASDPKNDNLFLVAEL